MLCRGDDYRSCFAPEATFASQNGIPRNCAGHDPTRNIVAAKAVRYKFCSNFDSKRP